jgi:hypothetical protein
MLQNAGFANGLANWSLFATPDNSYLVGQVLFGHLPLLSREPAAGHVQLRGDSAEHERRRRLW